jgi:hypothetical protein
MGDESTNIMQGGGIEATAQPQQTAPPWLAEAVVLVRTIWSTWALLPLCETVRVARGRAGLYDVCDVVLVLLAYAVSKAETLAAFFAQAAPVRTLLMASWQRARMPTASALSRFLSAVKATSSEQLRTLFLPTSRPTG